MAYPCQRAARAGLYYRNLLPAILLAWAFLPPGAAAADGAESAPPPLCAPPCAPASPAHRVRPQDEVWSIDSRGLCPSTADESVRQLRYQRFVPGTGWSRSDFAAFARQPAGMVTCFFIVGNYYTHAETLQTGWYAYQRLVSRNADEVSLRFVIWSWPSDPVPGRRLPDAKLKFTRVDPSAFRMAALIDRLDAETPISLVGSSFGASIAAGALELLAGGKLDRYQLPPRARPPRKIRLVMTGAAIHNDSLLPGRRYGRVLSQTERTLAFVNPSDRALRVYHYLFNPRSPVRALGRTGPVAVNRLPDASRLDLAWSAAYVGKQHGMLPYWQHATLVTWMRPYLLMQPLRGR
ncbi:MAG TPA: hypothetical protein VNH11_27665 [Pirellulales bacterium]|nr:hypothetical protein [Pirellulales bacterium]